MLRRRWPYLVLLLEVLVFYWRILFQPRTYVIPWDLRYYHWPLAEHMAKCLRDGHLPLWDPWTYCGMPFHAIVTTQAFYPPTLIAVLASNLWKGGRNLLYFLELQDIFHVFLAGIFAYLLVRRLTSSRVAALTGATVYQLGPFFTTQMQHIGAVNAAAWMPLALLAIVELSDRPNWRWLATLAVALAMTILSGFPAVTATVFVGCGMLVVWRLLLRRASWTLPLWAATGMLGAVLLSAVQLFPTLQLIRNSVAKYRADWLDDGGGHPVQALITLLIPNYWGVAQFDSMAWKLPWNATWMYLYCGIIGLICILAALFWLRNREALIFGAVTVCALFWMLGQNTPVGLWVFRALPYFIKAPLYAEYALPLFSLGMAVLAGLGAERITRGRNAAGGLLLVAAAAADLTFAGSGMRINTHKFSDEPGLAYSHYDGLKEIPETMRKLVNQTTPPARIDTMNGSINWAGNAALLQIPVATGNDPLALERYMQVRLSFCNGERWGRWYQIANLESPVLDLLNVRYVLSSNPLDAELVRRARFVPAARLPGNEVYENLDVLPRFFFARRVRSATGLQDAVAKIRAPGYNPREEAIVEGIPDGTFDTGAVRVLKYVPNEVVLETDTRAHAYLVTSEAHYPGWWATIDGVEHSIHYTNGAFRGLPVPAGRHTVVMRFSPDILWRSMALSGAGWVALLCALSLRRWNSRTRSKLPATS
jgi:hypothetical protein